MKSVSDGWVELTPEEYEKGVTFVQDRRLPVEYGTHIELRPTLHILRRTDESPDTPEWDDAAITQFETEVRD